jgi:hypothetical protein
MEGQMPTIVIDVPENFDTTKLLTTLGPIVMNGGFRVLKPGEVLHIADALPPKNGKKAPRHRKGGKSVIQSIMDHFTPAGNFLTMNAQAWVHQNQYDLKSASPALTALKKSGYIEQIGPGRFRFLRPLEQGADPRRAADSR